tara:strand:+ start:724 stop:1929 length:1206 start_codon:yes stop_codon:yes gene_type:complete
MTELKNMKFIDLFCGIGGFHQALIKFGCKCVFACDINKDCREVYENNYKLKPESDICKVNITEIPDFDILCGGFPCQSFSNAGKKKSLNDKRGKLFENIIKIAKQKQPKFMFLENVKHIKKIDNGSVFELIIKEFQNAGYYINSSDDNTNTVFQLSPHQLGIPQQRERIVFVCIRKDIYNKKPIKLDIPEIPIDFTRIYETDNNITKKYKISQDVEKVLDVWDEIITIMETNQKMSPTMLCDEFQNTYTEDEFKLLAKWRQEYITKNKPIYNKYKDKWDLWLEKHKNILSKRKIYSKLEWQAGKKKENDSIYNYFIQLRQSGIRVKRTKYFPTLVAIVQTPIYGKEKRYITPRECARLQSFPDSFILPIKDRIAYKQFGNAVNVDVIHKVASATFKTYNLL